jgi:hypothetical protein
MTMVFGAANQGKKSFDVSSAKVQVWRIRQPVPVDSSGYINFTSLESSPPMTVVNLNSQNSPLVGHFVPNAGLHQAFTWHLNGPPIDGFLIGRIDLYSRRSFLWGLIKTPEHPFAQASVWLEGKICKTDQR